MNPLLPLGVCYLPEPRRNAARSVVYPTYLREVFAHAGLAIDEVDYGSLAERLVSLRVLVTIGEAPLPEGFADWVRSGGAWISIGGSCGQGDLLGVAAETPAYSGWGTSLNNLGEGYAAPAGAHPLLPTDFPLHFFGGFPVTAAGADVVAAACDAHQRPTARAAITENRAGRGIAIGIFPDLTGTLVRIQQGTAITRDGVPAPDGTGPVNDTWLKTDDGQALDWILDREPIPGIEGLHGFLQPVADRWREILLRAVFRGAETVDAPVALLWYWPRNLPAVGHISHDTDGNDPGDARGLLATLAAAGIRSTWCVLAPGYDAALIAEIAAAGHELATHFDALDYPWAEESFETQWRFLSGLFGERPVSNKNHFLRWEGDVEFYGWLAARGMQLDQSKGTSKTGEAGYNFGTCHLYFPLDRDGAPIDVLELATPTQDLCVFAPPALLDSLLRQALASHGVLHLLFHPAHIPKPGVADAIKTAVARGRENGMEWWTARELNAWERARRRVRWSATASGLSIRAEAPLPEATLLARGAGWAQTGETVTRWGLPFQVLPFDADAGTEKIIAFPPKEANP